MRIRSATTGSIVDAYLMLQETVRVLSDPDTGAAMRASGSAERSMASCRTRSDNSRLEFVISPSLFVEDTMLVIMSSGQGCRHAISFPE